MKLHGNAALSLNGRRRMVGMVVEQDRSITQAATAAGVSDRTCSKWVRRYLADREAGLLDRSSAPRRVHNRTDEQLVELLAALRRLRFTAPELADLLDMPGSTISGILKRIGMGKLGRLGTGARRPLRARAPRRTDPHRRQKARPHPGRRRETHHRQTRPQRATESHRR